MPSVQSAGMAAFETQVAVVGLGAAGSAALWQLARAGCDVVGIDRFTPPHDRGSSHGQTRLLRVAYAEGAKYVPLVRRAITLWREIEAECGEPLFHQTGVFYAGDAASDFLTSSIASARAHDVRLQMLDGSEGMKCGLRVPPTWLAFVEAEGGFVEAEKAIATFLQASVGMGARVLCGRKVLAIRPKGEGVEIHTEGEVISAGKVVVAAGAWTPELLAELAPYLSLERRVLHWFADATGRFGVGAGFKPFIVEAGDGIEFYGFPAIDGQGVKAGEHDMRLGSGAAVARADGLDRAVSAAEKARAGALVNRFLPGLEGPQSSVVCMYPMSKDGDFILDRVDERVVVAAGLSGHGFKFVPALGEALAAMVLDRAPPIDVSFLSLKRFG
jgi:sarcosine oxidase